MVSCNQTPASKPAFHPKSRTRQPSALMKAWEKTFIEEGWVGKDFRIEISSFELMYMYVKPEYRRKGFASGLLNQVISYAKKSKIKKIYAYTGDIGNHALNFYIKKKEEIIYNLSEKDEQNYSAYLVWDLS